jgi:hypothetical protein
MGLTVVSEPVNNTAIGNAGAVNRDLQAGVRLLRRNYQISTHDPFSCQQLLYQG